MGDQQGGALEGNSIVAPATTGSTGCKGKLHTRIPVFKKNNEVTRVPKRGRTFAGVPYLMV